MTDYGRPSDEGIAADTARGDRPLHDLREILFGEQVASLEGELKDLERRVIDRDTLVALIAPVLGQAIRRQIQDAREEMIEALYPIIGQVVVRAVKEAIQDLARTIDARMRTSLSPRLWRRRLRARLGGVSDAELVLRESLPFSVIDVLLIHRESGLLLWHVSSAPEGVSDSDVISSMLTAIRDFAQDAFGRGQEGDLDTIEYGDRRILLEAARHAYLAVVVDGVEPSGFRARLREQVIEIDRVHERTLRSYDGDPAPLAPVDPALSALIRPAEPQERRYAPLWMWLLIVALIVVLLVLASLATKWGWFPG